MWGLRNQGYKCKGEADTEFFTWQSSLEVLLPTLAATSSVCGLLVFNFLCCACLRNENIVVLRIPKLRYFRIVIPSDRFPQKHTSILAMGIVVSEARGLILAIV